MAKSFKIANDVVPSFRDAFETPEIRNCWLCVNRTHLCFTLGLYLARRLPSSETSYARPRSLYSTIYPNDVGACTQ